MTWHVPPETLTAYLADDVSDVDAWSVEAHLTDCAHCRDRLTTRTHASEMGGADAAVVARVRDDIVDATLAAPGRVRAGTRRRQWLMLSRRVSVSGIAWGVATIIIAVAAVVLEIYAAGSGGPRSLPWLAILGPVIPVVGVAATYAAPLDEASEVVSATPMSGLRLLLWRTLAVLAVVVPVSLIASMVTTLTTSLSWLIPAAVLTVVTLALTSVVGSLVAAATVGFGWLTVVGVTGMGDDGVTAIRDLVSASLSTVTWLACGGIAAGVIYLRRTAYAAPSAALPTTSEESW